MSDYSQQYLHSNSVSSKLHVCLFSAQSQFTQLAIQLLKADHYQLEHFSLIDSLMDFVAQHKEQIDCLILVHEPETSSVWEQLWQAKILLPAVIVETESPSEIKFPAPKDAESASFELNVTDILYHQAEIRLYLIQLKELNSYINLAITKFLSLPLNCETSDTQPATNKINSTEGVSSSLVVQQRRLTNKIKERLGYLGVFYKRNTQDFYRNLSPEKQAQFLQELSISYRKILLNYFTTDSETNQLIDEFVDCAFFADISTSQILEIHMDLIDNFSQQLKIEGRNDDILLDYRLPLIDITAHLCEMYRRSIPGDDISLELLF